VTIVNVSFQQRLDQTNAVLTMIHDINSHEMTSKQVMRRDERKICSELD